MGSLQEEAGEWTHQGARWTLTGDRRASTMSKADGWMTIFEKEVAYV